MALCTGQAVIDVRDCDEVDYENGKLNGNHEEHQYSIKNRKWFEAKQHQEVGVAQKVGQKEA